MLGAQLRRTHSSRLVPATVPPRPSVTGGRAPCLAREGVRHPRVSIAVIDHGAIALRSAPSLSRKSCAYLRGDSFLRVWPRVRALPSVLSCRQSSGVFPDSPRWSGSPRMNLD